WPSAACGRRGTRCPTIRNRKLRPAWKRKGARDRAAHGGGRLHGVRDRPPHVAADDAAAGRRTRAACCTPKKIKMMPRRFVKGSTSLTLRRLASMPPRTKNTPPRKIKRLYVSLWRSHEYSAPATKTTPPTADNR